MTTKTEMLKVRIEEKELDRARAIAKMRGMSLSGYTRWAMLENIPRSWLAEVKRESVS